MFTVLCLNSGTQLPKPASLVPLTSTTIQPEETANAVLQDLSLTLQPLNAIADLQLLTWTLFTTDVSPVMLLMSGTLILSTVAVLPTLPSRVRLVPVEPVPY